MSHDGYEHLVVWQEAIKLVKRIYRMTKRFPADEKSGMIAAMRKLSMSMPGKIAEATVIDCPKSLAEQIDKLRGPVRELESYVTLSLHLGYITRFGAWKMRRFLRYYAELLANEALLIGDLGAQEAQAPRLAA